MHATHTPQSTFQRCGNCGRALSLRACARAVFLLTPVPTLPTPAHSLTGRHAQPRIRGPPGSGGSGNGNGTSSASEAEGAANQGDLVPHRPEDRFREVGALRCAVLCAALCAGAGAAALRCAVCWCCCCALARGASEFSSKVMFCSLQAGRRMGREGSGCLTSPGSHSLDQIQRSAVTPPPKHTAILQRPPPPPLPQVFAVPLPRRPLLPGGIMPVTVQNNKLIKELVDLRRQGYTPALFSRYFFIFYHACDGAKQQADPGAGGPAAAGVRGRLFFQ